MSAWSEAVWIVKRLEKNFNFGVQISQYVGALNQVNTEINNLKTILDDINDTTVTIAAKKKINEEEPDTNIPAIEGAVWFVLSE